MLSSRSRYALRALSHLAEFSPAPQTTDQIAAATGLPPATLSKILQALNQTGIVKTQRGVGGGVGLARSADGLTVKEVVDAVDPTRCLHEVASGAHCRCLQRRLQVVMALADFVLQETTIAELVSTHPSGNDKSSTIDLLLDNLVRTTGLGSCCIDTSQGTGQ